MPKTFEMGLVGFNPGNPESKAVETPIFRPCMGHALITGANGIGKTTAIIEPASRTLSLKSRTKKDRQGYAEYMKAKNATQPFVYYEEAVITNKTVSKDSNAVMFGMYIDNGNYGNEARAQEHGFLFIYQHSASLLSEIDNDTPIYEQLGIHFVKHADGDRNRKRINDRDAVKQEIRQKGGSVYNIPANTAHDRSFLKDLSAITGHDYITDRIIREEASREEALEGLAKMSGNEVLDKFVFRALDSKFLPDESASTAAGNIVSYCVSLENEAGQRETVELLEQMHRSLLNMVLPRAEEYEQIAGGRKGKAEDAAQLLANIRASKELSAKEEEKHEAALKAIDKDVDAARMEQESQKCWKLDDSRKREAERLEGAKSKLAEAEAALYKAGCDHYLAQAQNAAHLYAQAADEASALENAISAAEQETESERADDLAWTLHRRHEERKAAAGKSMQDAKAEQEKAKKAAISAVREEAQAEVGLDSAKKTLEDAREKVQDVVKSIAETLETTELATGGMTERPTSWKAVRTASDQAFADAQRLDKEAAEHRKAKDDAENRIEALRDELSDAKSEATTKKKAEQDAVEALEKLNQLISDTMEHGFERESLSSKESCQDTYNRIDARRDEARRKESDVAARIDQLKKRLKDAREGLLQVQPTAIDIIKSEGIDCYAADEFLRDQLDQATILGIRKRWPWITAAVVVDCDDDMERAKDAIAAADNQWFPGGIGIMSKELLRSLDRGDGPADGQRHYCFTARPDEAYLLDPEKWKTGIDAQIGELEDKSLEIGKQIHSINDQCTRLMALKYRYTDELASVEAYEKQVADAQKATEQAKAECESLEKRLSDAESLREQHSEKAKAAEKGAEGKRMLAGRFNEALMKRDRLDEADKRVETACNGIAKAEKRLDDAKTARSKAEKIQEEKDERYCEAESHCNKIKNELYNVDLSAPKHGTMVENVPFEALLSEYRELRGIIREKTKELEPLRKRLEEAKGKADDLLEQRNAKAKQLESWAGKTIDAEPKAIPGGRRVDLENAFGDASRTKSACEDKLGSAQSAASAAEQEYGHELRNFTRKWERFPLPREEIGVDGDPSARVIVLEKQRKDVDAQLSAVREGKGKLTAAAAHLTPFGLPTREPSEKIDPSKAERMAADAAEALEKAGRQAKDAQQNMIEAIERHNKTAENMGNKDVIDVATIDNMPKNHTTEAIKHIGKSIKATADSTRQASTLIEEELESVYMLVKKVAEDSRKKLREIQGNSKGFVRFELGRYDRGMNDQSREDHLRRMVKDGCTRISNAARENGKLNEDTLRKLAKERILNVRSILEAWCGLPPAAEEKQRIGLSVRSPRKGESNFIPWDKLKELSGGEKRGARLVTIIALQSACVGEKGGSSVMYLDTPFSGLNNSALIEPIFEVCEKTNTQLIVVQDSVNDHIAAKFPFRARLLSGTFGGAQCAVSKVDADGKDTLVETFSEIGVAVQPALGL